MSLQTTGLMLGFLVAVGVAGCAAFHPVHGVPARYVGDEHKVGTRSSKQTIDLGLLRRNRPPAHIVDSGDVLAIYIEGILGKREEAPPVFLPTRGDLDMQPALGFPIPVRDDGTISLPLVGSLTVRGLTMVQVEQLLRDKYRGEKEFLNPDNVRILASLQRPRQYRVLVLRQESGSDLFNASTGGQLNLGALKRGTGRVVSLPVYQNDVLHALAETGGLPGLDAENAIYIIRRGPSGPAPISGGGYSTPTPAPLIRGQSPDRFAPPYPPQNSALNASGFTPPSPTPTQSYSSPPTTAWPMLLPPQLPTTDRMPVQFDPSAMPVEAWSRQFEGMGPLAEHGVGARRVVRIPIRLGPSEVVDINEQDIVLHDGDIVFIESRDTEVFYTGGLLGGGQYTLPRDYDLDILGAIAIAQGRSMGNNGSTSMSSSGGVSALNGDVTISGSSVVILRPLPDGSQLPIQIDLYRALRDPSERVVIQPGDYILLQYTKMEAVGAVIQRHLLEGALFGLAAAQLNQGGGN